MLFSVIAGVLGALTGLGGGVVIIPVLVLLFHIDIHYAMGASLITVITTSSGAAAAYLRDGYTNLRIGMFLEAAAVIGALAGASIVAFTSKSVLTIIFSLVLFLSAYLTIRRREENEQYTQSHPIAVKLKLDGSYPTSNGLQRYHVQHPLLGLVLMGFAGMLSGLLGVGAGILKVLAMDQTLRLPYKVATTTSNFMIGITAAASAGIYFTNGYIVPAIAFPVMLGVMIGSFYGAKLISYIHTQMLRIIFSIVISLVGMQMLINTLQGTL
jgi:uncharacterized membrane protein YfcA